MNTATSSNTLNKITVLSDRTIFEIQASKSTCECADNVILTELENRIEGTIVTRTSSQIVAEFPVNSLGNAGSLFINSVTGTCMEIQDIGNLIYSIDSSTTHRIRDEIILHGWIFHTKISIKSISILINDVEHQCKYGDIARPDVANAYNKINEKLTTVSGFECWLNLTEPHEGKLFFLVTLMSDTKIIQEINREFSFYDSRHLVPELEDNQLNRYKKWMSNNEVTYLESYHLEKRLNNIEGTRLSVIMPTYNTDPEFLGAAIQSLENQLYKNWELCIADDCSTNIDTLELLDKLDNDNIKIIRKDSNTNISDATNVAASQATGTYLVFMDHDDLLTPDALAEVALTISEHPNADIIYSDDDKIDMEGNRYDQQFKPDWSPELLLSYMYFSHLFVVRKDIYGKVGGMRVGYEGSQDYDFALRATEQCRDIVHIPKVLYHWRATPGSTAVSGSEKPDSFNAGIRAVQDAFDRRNIRAEAYQPDWARQSGLGIYSHKFPDDGPDITIIIPTKNNKTILSRCIESLDKTTYKNYSVLIVDNESTNLDTLEYYKTIDHTVVTIPNRDEHFNYSYINNQAIKYANSEYLVLLNDDTEVIEPGWLSSMIGYGQMEGVGAVGAKLLFPDNTIQHAGIVHGLYNGAAGPAFKHTAPDSFGYLSYINTVKNYSAVTAACLLIKKDAFVEIGCLDETNFAVAYNDVDLCYRLVNSNHRCVYSADSVLYHHEGYSRGYNDNPEELYNFKQKYKYFAEKYYNPNLSLENEHFLTSTERYRTLYPRSQCISVLVFTHNLNYEGAPISLMEMVVELKRQGVIEPIVVSPVDGPLNKLYHDNGISAWVIKTKFTQVAPFDNYDALKKDISRMIKGIKPDVVFANTYESFYAIDIANDMGTPSIWTIRESENWTTYFDKYGENIFKIALNCFEHPYRIIFVANATKEGCRHANVSLNFSVIHNGLNHTRFYSDSNSIDIRDKYNISEHDTIFLSVATTCDRKGQMDIIDAAFELSDEAIDSSFFIVLGDRPGEYSSKLHGKLESLPEHRRNKFLLLQETGNVMPFYSSAGAFILTSRMESYPRVILEAQHFELPIITTPVNGIVEQVNHNNSLFYEPGDVRLLAQHITDLSRNRTKLESMSRNSKYNYKTLNSFYDMAEQYKKIIINAANI